MSGRGYRTPPERIFDRGVQQERTALAWERTAISMMVAGVLMARYAATSTNVGFAGIGILQVLFGSGILVWAGWHYDDLHGELRAGRSPIHPAGARATGLAAIAFTGSGMILAFVVAVRS